MNCRKVTEKLMAFRDGELPEDEIQILREHLHMCPPCIDLFDGYEEVVEVLKPPPPGEHARGLPEADEGPAVRGARERVGTGPARRNNLPPMNILLTGAAGQVGTDLLPLMIARGDTITAFDLAPRPDSCPPEVEWIRGDVTQEAEVFDAVKRSHADRIFHFAAILSAVGEQVPHRAWRVNMDGTRNILEAARLFDVEQVFFTSTIAAFGAGSHAARR